MVKETTAKRLNQLMSERGLKQVRILEACKPYCEKYGVKINKSHLSQYVSGEVQPGQDKLSILGMALNVSEAWLMGYDVSRERDPDLPPGPDQPPLAADEQALLSDYRSLNDLGKQEARKRVNELTQINQYKLTDSSDEYEIVPIAARGGDGKPLEMKKKKGKSIHDLPDYHGGRR